MNQFIKIENIDSDAALQLGEAISKLESDKDTLNIIVDSNGGYVDSGELLTHLISDLKKVNIYILKSNSSGFMFLYNYYNSNKDKFKRGDCKILAFPSSYGIIHRERCEVDIHWDGKSNYINQRNLEAMYNGKDKLEPLIKRLSHEDKIEYENNRDVYLNSETLNKIFNPQIPDYAKLVYGENEEEDKDIIVDVR